MCIRDRDLPVLLVLRPRGASLTLAAQVRGLLAFRQPSHIAGILLNDCSAMLDVYKRQWQGKPPAARWKRTAATTSTRRTAR